MGGMDSTRTVDGDGTKTVEIDAGDSGIVSANAQKQDDSSSKLTIQILHNGKVVEESSTSAEYGMVQISYSEPLFG